MRLLVIALALGQLMHLAVAAAAKDRRLICEQRTIIFPDPDGTVKVLPSTALSFELDLQGAGARLRITGVTSWIGFELRHKHVAHQWRYLLLPKPMDRRTVSTVYLSSDVDGRNMWFRWASAANTINGTCRPRA